MKYSTEHGIDPADPEEFLAETGMGVTAVCGGKKVLVGRFSIIYNVIGLTLGSPGMLTPVLAVIFQEAGCVTVVLSSTLLLWSRPPMAGRPAKNAAA